jgi:hypothetical protein
MRFASSSVVRTTASLINASLVLFVSFTVAEKVRHYGSARRISAKDVSNRKSRNCLWVTATMARPQAAAHVGRALRFTVGNF